MAYTGVVAQCFKEDEKRLETLADAALEEIETLKTALKNEEAASESPSDSDKYVTD
jgi:hypothetical protein